MHHILCANPFISRDFYAIRPLILWHILGSYVLLLWGVGVAETVFTFQNFSAPPWSIPCQAQMCQSGFFSESHDLGIRCQCQCQCQVQFSPKAVFDLHVRVSCLFGPKDADHLSDHVHGKILKGVNICLCRDIRTSGCTSSSQRRVYYS